MAALSNTLLLGCRESRTLLTLPRTLGRVKPSPHSSQNFGKSQAVSSLFPELWEGSTSLLCLPRGLQQCSLEGLSRRSDLTCEKSTRVEGSFLLPQQSSISSYLGYFFYQKCSSQRMLLSIEHLYFLPFKCYIYVFVWRLLVCASCNSITNRIGFTVMCGAICRSTDVRNSCSTRLTNGQTFVRLFSFPCY